MKARTSRTAVLLATMAAASCAAASDSGDVSQGRRPNVVFVLLDDVRYDDLIDHPFVQLPNINRLAREGTSFRRFFTSAPLCSPSRAIFLTGQYASHNGITDNGERAELSHRIVTFPKLLHDAGYRTGFFGKWHMGHADDSPRPGFDRWVSFVGQGVYFDPALNIDGAPAEGEGYVTDILTDHAVSFIETVPEGTPFLTFIAHKAVHPEVFPDYVRTFPPAPGDEGLYEGAELERSPSWRAPATGKPALSRPVDVNDPRSPAGGLPDDIILDRLRMLSAVDRGIGRLMDTLEERDLLDETVFVLTSDQGFFYGEFGLAQERRLAYEPSTRIPLIVRYPPLVDAGSTRDALASNVDVAPTMLELASLPIPTTMDGSSLAPVLADRAASVRADLLIEYASDQVFPRLQNMGYKAVRTDRYKYIRYEELRGMDELYDLSTDPHELDNLLPDRAPAGVLEDLTARLEAHLRFARSGPA